MWNRPGDPHRNHVIGMCLKASLGCLSLCLLVITGEKVAVILFGFSIFPNILIFVLILIFIFAGITLGVGLRLAYIEIKGIRLLNTEINFTFFPMETAPGIEIIKQHTGLPHDSATALFEIRNNPDSSILVTAYVVNENVRIFGHAARTTLLRGNHYPILLVLDWYGNEVAAVSCQFIEKIEILPDIYPQ